MKPYTGRGDVKNRPSPSRMKSSGYHHAPHGAHKPKEKK